MSDTAHVHRPEWISLRAAITWLTKQKLSEEDAKDWLRCLFEDFGIEEATYTGKFVRLRFLEPSHIDQETSWDGSINWEKSRIMAPDHGQAQGSLGVALIEISADALEDDFLSIKGRRSSGNRAYDRERDAKSRRAAQAGRELADAGGTKARDDFESAMANLEAMRRMAKARGDGTNQDLEGPANIEAIRAAAFDDPRSAPPFTLPQVVESEAATPKKGGCESLSSDAGAPSGEGAPVTMAAADSGREAGPVPKPGRRRGLSYATADDLLVPLMDELIRTGRAASSTQAANIILGAEPGRVAGSGTPDSRARRVALHYRRRTAV